MQVQPFQWQHGGRLCYACAVFAWFRRKDALADPEQGRALISAVRGALPSDDDELVRIIASVAALLLCVAYADLDVRPEELEQSRRTLSRVQGLDARGVNAIIDVLHRHSVHIARAEATTYARELLSLTEEDFRVELLDALVDVAAADDEISVAETNLLRGVASALGLSQEHYNRSQARHRDRLAVLK